MAYHNFMLADVTATIIASLLYALFLFVPGYVVSWTFDLLDFRRQSFFLKCATAMAVSCALSPIVAYLSWTFVSLTMVWIVFGLLWAAFIVIVIRQCLAIGFSRLGKPDKESVTLVALAFLWCAVATFSVIDLQFDRRLYLSVINFDYMLRVKIVSVIARDGLPAHNPSFYAGHFVPLRYHFFGMLIASLVEKLSGGTVTARNAMFALPLWCGLILMSLVCLYLRFLRDNGAAEGGTASFKAHAWKRKAAISVALIAVTGLDILPTAHIYFTQHLILPDMEWWNEQITSWIDTLLWVPHHLAALLACLAGFLVFYRGAGSNINRNVVIAVITGLAYASAVGLSVYVGFVFAIFAVQWCLVLARKKAYRELGTLALSGVIALTCLLPFIAEVASSGAGQGSGGSTFVQFKVRSFVLAERLLMASHITDPGLITLGNLFTLPINYFLELGFFLLVIVWRLKRFFRQRKRTNAEWCAVLMLVTGLLVSMFLRSATISNNDLGWRSCLFVQFIALLWAPEYLTALFSRKRLGGGSSQLKRRAWAVVATACLMLGLAGSIHQTLVLRYYSALTDARLVHLGLADWLAPDTNTGKRSYAMREAYTWLQRKLPQDAIEQHNPSLYTDDVYSGVYGERQMVASEVGCNVAFGGDARDCLAVTRPIFDLFRNPTLDFQQVDAVCKALSIDVLIARDRDRVWSSPNSWVWKTQPIFANDYVRVFSCH